MKKAIYIILPIFFTFVLIFSVWQSFTEFVVWDIHELPFSTFYLIFN